MKKNIITISRQFGSGGRTIAKQLAENLGYTYYDREIIEQVAKQSGFEEEFIAKHGEYAPGNSSLIYSFLGRNQQGLSTIDQLWAMQRQLILDYAQKGNCVIVGRCADYILKERNDVLNVFIHASLPFREKRIVKVYGETENSPEARILDKDKKRAINYKYYTDQNWGEAKNYHIT
ncbi:MAG: cytidylate kinase-like family protein, partial [Lachnospiraceae bacterium]|nr:cytidylate kinase-like family protein [Lachnospiraceae bacterium]